MTDELKIIKKERIMTILLVFLLLLFVFLIIFVAANKEQNIVEEEKFDKTDANNYVKVESVDTTPYLSVYRSVNLKKLTFTTITEILVGNFYTKQEEYLNILENNIDTNKKFIEKYNVDNNIANYTANSKIDSILLYDIKDDVLSVLYLIEDKVDYKELNNYIVNVFIDIENNSLVDTDTLLNKYLVTKDEIASRIFDIILEKNKELNNDDIKNKREEYTKKIIDNFDRYIYLYFNDDSLYLKYNRNNIINDLFDTNLENIEYSTLKIDIIK